MSVPAPILPDPVVTVSPGRIQTTTRVLAVLAIVSTILVVVNYLQLDSKKQFCFSYLVSFVYVASILLGSLFWVLIHHLTGAGWSTVVRRLWENNTRAFPLLAIFSIPLVLHLPELYKWANPDAYVHSMHGMVKVSDDPILKAKNIDDLTGDWFHLDLPWFDKGFFLGRFAFYVAVWLFFSLSLARWSQAQDTTGDSSYSKRMARYAPVGMILLALTSTFFNFDWNMSLDYHWFSTIFGVYYWAGSINCAMASMVLTVLFLHSTGRLRNTITIEQLHDMGKIMFGFTIFWTYIGFSQYFLYWYANLPEETIWYQKRRIGLWNEGNWNTMSWCLLVGRFIIPFFWLIRRKMKRNKLALAIASVWIMGIHYLDLYWQIMPNYMNKYDHPSGTTGVQPTALDGLCWLMLISITAYYVVSRQWTARPLIPVGDPRLEESLHHKNHW